MCAIVADERPWWEPGTRSGNHAQTFGFLLDETIRRATGQTISAHFRTLITDPLDITDNVHFSVPRTLLPRIAQQVDPDHHGAQVSAPGSPLDRAMPPGIWPSADLANRADVLTADIPSAGTMTARGVARSSMPASSSCLRTFCLSLALVAWCMSV